MIISNINSYASTQTNKIFNVTLNIDGILSSVTFIADIEENGSIFDNEKSSNFCCLYDYANGQIIHNLYDMSTAFIKKPIFTAESYNKSNMTMDFCNVISHQPKTIASDIIQINNDIYALEKQTTEGYLANENDIYSDLSVDNLVYEISCNQISSYLYDKQKLISLLQNETFDESAYKKVFNNIEHDILYEFPSNFYNDFYSGNVLANAIKCKNNFNSTYDMCHNETYQIMNSREYTGIGKCGNLMFLRYKDCIDYADEKSNKEKKDENYFGMRCENVEVISKINRYSQNSVHSSNLYSLNIKTDAFRRVQNDDLKNKLKSEVQNCVRSITDALAPVHSQLLSVFISDVF